MRVYDRAKHQQTSVLPERVPRDIRAASGEVHVWIYLLTALIVLIGLGIRLDGYPLSLWNDEAWLANSVAAHSWTDTYFYPSWLQTSPPLFLFFARIVVQVFGLSHATLRLIPFSLSLAGLLVGIIVFFRSFPQQYAMLATALLALSPQPRNMASPLNNIVESY